MVKWGAREKSTEQVASHADILLAHHVSAWSAKRISAWEATEQGDSSSVPTLHMGIRVDASSSHKMKCYKFLLLVDNFLIQ